ncbi:anaerobic ribonucleoside-triphosphate reductase activating protein [Brucepastera parasyntrophica]|uniref:anaerobic ribonucleoside-triphosphate reductase activating protein n=1 Tax=Brucepastera parasyntrophica TaxID=2880008 RepID=UPI00210BB343|nr:anaerobic ribonucleoside-triphosphate reductase activating protein [Brucepastera parasyntrophica]ULQ60469.1 anaerobic ribonucleoside-triphosphate reductase activating protein [Brucepastera parasyntrophica]
MPVPMIRLAGIVEESTVDGPGYRFAIFTQGCPHRCPGCHNPETHPAEGGFFISADELFSEIMKNPLLKGVTFSGGEPFFQAAGLAALAEKIHTTDLNVITYSGYTYEEIIKGADTENCWMRLLEQTDYLIDGPFVQEEKSLELQFRGSRNQRIIDIKASLKKDSVVEVSF